jgi:hypothetical protein
MALTAPRTILATEHHALAHSFAPAQSNQAVTGSAQTDPRIRQVRTATPGHAP